MTSQVAVQNNAPVQEELHRLGGATARDWKGDGMGRANHHSINHYDYPLFTTIINM